MQNENAAKPPPQKPYILFPKNTIVFITAAPGPHLPNANESNISSLFTKFSLFTNSSSRIGNIEAIFPNICKPNLAKI